MDQVDKTTTSWPEPRPSSQEVVLLASDPLVGGKPLGGPGSLDPPGDHYARPKSGAVLRFPTASESLGKVREGKVVCETPAGEVLPGPTGKNGAG